MTRFFEDILRQPDKLLRDCDSFRFASFIDEDEGKLLSDEITSSLQSDRT